MNLPTWPFYDSSQIEAACRVLESGKVNVWTGSQTIEFEHEFASWCGSDFAIALANGSLALSTAYLSIGLSPGDEIITTPRSFIATAASAALLGAKVVFADVDPASGNITPESVAPLITSRTKAIVIVHLAGWPADMHGFMDLAAEHNIYVIEDCAQAHGARISGRSVGSFGHINAWSFCQDKIISTAGEGGMVTTSSKELWEKSWSIKDHGKSIRTISSTHNITGYRFIHDNFGSNFRLTEFQSSIGRIQLSILTDWTSTRARNASILIEHLQDLAALRIPLPESNLTHAWYKFYIYIEPSSMLGDWSRDRIIEEIKLTGYPAFSGSCSELYLEKCFIDSGMSPSNRLPIAKMLGETSIMLLVHPTIGAEQMHIYAEEVRSVISRSTR